MSTPRTSLADIAREAGVSKMTVSLALRSHPRIPARTRDRIQAMARRMGYNPNPEVSRLMAAIRHDSSSGSGLPLAYLTSGRRKGLWRTSATEVSYWEGACARAKEHGYYIDEYWIEEPNMSEGRLSDILWHRGIRGIIVPPFYRTLKRHARALALHIDWPRFSAVTISDMLSEPPLNRVIHDHYTSMLSTLAALGRLGYRKAGLCLTEHMDLTVNQRWQAAYRVFGAGRDAAPVCCEPLILPDLGPVPIRQWARSNRLDVIISAEKRMPEFFRELGWEMGRSMAYADLDIQPCEPGHQRMSGILQNSSKMGSAAVDLVIAAINRDELGIPDIPLVLQIEGTWRGSDSTPPARARSRRRTTRSS